MNPNREDANGQCTLTPEFSSLLGSFNELATKNLEMLRLGKDSGNELGMDQFGNFVRDFNRLSLKPPFRIFSEYSTVFFLLYPIAGSLTGLWYRLYFMENNPSQKSLSPGRKLYELIL